MQIFVCLVKSELTIFIFLSQVSLRTVLHQYQVSLRSLSTYFIRQTKPKMLRLVIVTIIIIAR